MFDTTINLCLFFLIPSFHENNNIHVVLSFQAKINLIEIKWSVFTIIQNNLLL